MRTYFVLETISQVLTVAYQWEGLSPSLIHDLFLVKAPLAIRTSSIPWVRIKPILTKSRSHLSKDSWLLISVVILLDLSMPISLWSWNQTKTPWSFNTLFLVLFSPLLVLLLCSPYKYPSIAHTLAGVQNSNGSRGQARQVTYTQFR